MKAMMKIKILLILFISLLSFLNGTAQSHTVRRVTTSNHSKANTKRQPKEKQQKEQLKLKGSFYNSKHSWPVEFAIQINDDGQISGVYKNISQKVNLHIAGQLYSDGSMEIHDQSGNLYVHLNNTRNHEYDGQATSGQTTLNVRLTEN